MDEFIEVTVCLSREFLSQLKINCQAKGLFPDLKKRRTTAAECLALIVMLVGNNADEEQIEGLLPDEWYGHIGTPLKVDK